MSFLTEINCVTILEAIKNEKLRQKKEIDTDSDDFVKLNSTVNTFWTDLFANCFLVHEDDDADAEEIKRNSLVHDDMLFFVNLNNKSIEKNEIEVYRRDSKLLPCLTDLRYEWEETVYLNLILHEFEYTLTCAICTQASNKELEILKRHSKRVYASPSKRDLSSKGTEETMTYPNIYFTVDDFDEAFNEMIVRENEMVCVELLANDGKIQKVLFLGSIKYESLRKVYDARATTSSKLVNKVKLSIGSVTEKRVEFVRMKGPGGKGHAEMAVSRNQKPAISPSLSANFGADSFQNILKFPSMFSKRKSTSGLEATTSITYPMRSSVWDRTVGQAMTWLNKPENPDQKEMFEINKHNDPDTQHSSRESDEAGTSAAADFRASQSSVPLNAYLTYVTLRLQIIIQDVLEARHKSLLTA